MTFGYVLLISFWTVLVAELITDKSLYTVASLSLRFRFDLVFLGTTTAFAGKMLLAVMLGQAMARIPAPLAALLSALVFFLAALFIWIRKPAPPVEPGGGSAIWSRAAMVPFASLFLTEWGDPGQITAAALASQFHLVVAVWLGGTLALMTKGAVAMTLGVKLRGRISETALRGVATGSCCTLGILALRDSLVR